MLELKSVKKDPDEFHHISRHFFSTHTQYIYTYILHIYYIYYVIYTYITQIYIYIYITYI